MSFAQGSCKEASKINKKHLKQLLWRKKRHGCYSHRETGNDFIERGFLILPRLITVWQVLNTCGTFFTTVQMHKYA